MHLYHFISYTMILSRLFDNVHVVMRARGGTHGNTFECQYICYDAPSIPPRFLVKWHNRYFKKGDESEKYAWKYPEELTNHIKRDKVQMVSWQTFKTSSACDLTYLIPAPPSE
jgi:hypothetical protein